MPRPTDSAPCGSKSTSSTRRPCSASAAPRLIVVVVLPTPPFWLQTAATLAGPCVNSGSGSGKMGTGRPVGPSTPGLTSNVRDAATAYCTSPAVAVMRPLKSRTLGEARAWALRRQADSPFERKRRVRNVRSTQCAGVRAGVDLAELVHGDQRVDLGGRDRGMTEKLLHDPNVRAAVQEMRREGMPQGVRRHLGDPGPQRRGAQHGPGALPGQPPAAG